MRQKCVLLRKTWSTEPSIWVWIFAAPSPSKRSGFTGTNSLWGFEWCLNIVDENVNTSKYRTNKTSMAANNTFKCQGAIIFLMSVENNSSCDVILILHRNCIKQFELTLTVAVSCACVWLCSLRGHHVRRNNILWYCYYDNYVVLRRTTNTLQCFKIYIWLRTTLATEVNTLHAVSFSFTFHSCCFPLLSLRSLWPEI